MIVYYIVVIVGGVFDYRLLSISAGLDFAAIISYIILNVDGPIDPVATVRSGRENPYRVGRSAK